jgi:putative Mn2+ efflux pump MntP
LGDAIQSCISAYARLIASRLLLFIGIKIIYKIFYTKSEGDAGFLNYSVLFILSIATSIDAFAAGTSLIFLKVPFLSLRFLWLFDLFMSFFKLVGLEKLKQILSIYKSINSNAWKFFSQVKIGYVFYLLVWSWNG